MYLPRFVFNLISSETGATFSLTPDGIVCFRSESAAFEELVPSLAELLKVCAITTADSSPSLQVERVPPPFDVIVGVAVLPLLREAAGKRSVAVLAFAPSDRQAHALFGLMPDVIALAHPDGALRAPIRPPERSHARNP